MPDLVIRIKKKPDGSAALACTRADGTATWQQQNGQLGRFFPLHDLTHYAVETVLGLRHAFYGLVAEGWGFTDFGAGGTKGPIPEQARFAELIIGYFDLERRMGTLATADELNAQTAQRYADDKLPPPSIALTDDQVRRIRQLRGELFARWDAIPPGEALELEFNRDAESAVGHKPRNQPVG
jgi:hypothetical protein